MDQYSWARQCACCLAFAFAWLASPGELDLAAACAQDSAHDCVGFEKGEADHALLFRAINSCERKLECTLDYRLSCEDAQSRTTSSAALQVPFQLAPKGERNLTLSAASCKQGFRIEDVGWKCF